MSARIVVKFNHIPALMRRTPQEIDKAIEAMAREGERDVKQSFRVSPSPVGQPPGVDTGTLSSSIRVRPLRFMAREIVDGVEYGVHLEYGTRRMGARPFMGPMAQRLLARAPQFFDDLFDV